MGDTHSSPSGPIADTHYGLVRGRRIDGVDRFLGIPYAAAPVRFELPSPPNAWAGIREADLQGPSAPHRVTPFPGIDVLALVGDGGTRGADYLNLNIWKPASGEGWPVMVFIHGGGFVVGSKDAPVQDGGSFARSGVVCVAINYRLGIDGFLPVPGAPTNLGLRDMIFALQWVHENVAAFGGNPENVTVFGESAGAMAIADLVTSPLAAGLFQRAIIQSGHGSMVREIPVAQRLVRKLARTLKVSPDADGFRKVGIEDGLDAMARVSKPFARLDLRGADGREPVFGISRFIPVIGDDVLPQSPMAALKSGVGCDIDVLIGTNSEEMNLYFVPTGIRRKIGRILSRWVLGRSQPNPGAVLRDYGMGKRGVRPGDAFTRAMHDLVFRWPARQYAAAHQGRTWFYEFDWRSPAFEGELGACHAIELPFVFDTLPVATGPQGLAGEAPPQALAKRVHALWVEFARDGTLPWPQFDGQTRQVHLLERGDTVREDVLPAAYHLPE
ncbi:carboxylesterase/lipase family protein [Novosphingobium sp. PP1Y]|uniref:carboxylesterase/lipase family protein n=1 Tax=Novosphingobium sp. PP1Y TaxID=702113 RepID=UPI00020EF8F4|nr:carboxylesterase family protein [Novosphingobium sp. PP1Y]CCA90772.1 carboxylesterase type B [Novosphingobium sp. PP1Y]